MTLEELIKRIIDGRSMVDDQAQGHFDPLKAGEAALRMKMNAENQALRNAAEASERGNRLGEWLTEMSVKSIQRRR